MKALRALGFVTAALTTVAAIAQEFSVRPDRETGIYQAGETVKWTVEIKGDATALTSPKFAIKPGGQNASKQGPLELTDGKMVIEAQSANPGWILLEVTGKKADGKDVRGLGGALFSGEQIKPSTPCPEDFDAFWQAKLDDLAKVPAAPVLQKADSGREGVDYALITMNNIRGSHIYGQIAKPAKEGKFPAYLQLQWAGVYPLSKGWVVDRANEGWLAMNIQAHDLPVTTQPEVFFKHQSDGALKDYAKIGNEDRETSYFLRMYLSCYRAAEYLTTRDDWDGRIFVVTGGSQGGLQTIVTAALHPKVTAAIASVPAGCDHTGPDAGRAPGWPMWNLWNAKEKDPAKVKEASRYFDVVNFAARVKCPVLIGAGGIDTTCPPSGVFAMYNQLNVPKEMIFMPLADHMGKHDAYYARNGVWMNAAKTAAPLPPK